MKYAGSRRKILHWVPCINLVMVRLLIVDNAELRLLWILSACFFLVEFRVYSQYGCRFDQAKRRSCVEGYFRLRGRTAVRAVAGCLKGFTTGALECQFRLIFEIRITLSRAAPCKISFLSFLTSCIRIVFHAARAGTSHCVGIAGKCWLSIKMRPKGSHFRRSGTDLRRGSLQS